MYLKDWTSCSIFHFNDAYTLKKILLNTSDFQVLGHQSPSLICWSTSSWLLAHMNGMRIKISQVFFRPYGSNSDVKRGVCDTLMAVCFVMRLYMRKKKSFWVSVQSAEYSIRMRCNLSSSRKQFQYFCK